MLADDRLRLIRVKIERAYKHIEDLEDAIAPFVGPVFKSVSFDRDPETGKPRLQTEPLYIYTSNIPAIAGDAVHNLMSSLDHLAFQLVSVGAARGIVRKEKPETIQFPIAHDAKTYESRKLRYVDGATPEAIEAVDRLKPYKGGNDALFLLYKLDIADKHQSIFPMGKDFIMDGVSFKSDEPFFSGLGIPDQEKNMNLTGDESFIQLAVERSNPLLPTLHQLADLVSNIVSSFRPLLESPVIAPKTLSFMEEFESLGFPKE